MLVNTEQPIENLLRELISQWSIRDVTFNGGTTEAALSAFENRYDVKIPPNFRTYLLLVNGMPEYEIDGLTSLWSLDRFRQLNDRFSYYKDQDLQSPRYLAPLPENWFRLAEPIKDKTDNEEDNYRFLIPDASKCFLFGDYNINACFWAINLSMSTGSNPVYMIYDGSNDYHQVADSFYHFIEQFVNDCPEVLL